jgi:hypothetical protein
VWCPLACCSLRVYCWLLCVWYLFIRADDVVCVCVAGWGCVPPRRRPRRPVPVCVWWGLFGAGRCRCACGGACLWWRGLRLLSSVLHTLHSCFFILCLARHRAACAARGPPIPGVACGLWPVCGVWAGGAWGPRRGASQTTQRLQRALAAQSAQAATSARARALPGVPVKHHQVYQ